MIDSKIMSHHFVPLKLSFVVLLTTKTHIILVQSHFSTFCISASHTLYLSKFIFCYFCLLSFSGEEYLSINFFRSYCSIKYAVCSFPLGLAVRTSTPFSVTTIVCSNWADNFPSVVTAVQLSGQVWSDQTPEMRIKRVF